MFSKYLLPILAVVGCTGADPSTGAPNATPTDTGADALALVGTYTDTWGTTHTITADTWTQAYPGYDPLVFHLGAYDNDAGWVVGQNDAANGFDPEKWSRFDWADDADGHRWYCQSAFDVEDEDAAIAAPGADPDDLAAGCGGFAWTDLTP